MESAGLSTARRLRIVTARLARTLAVGLLAAMAIVAMAATVASLFARQWWLADLLTNFRVQLTWVLAVCAVGLVALRAPGWAAFACAGAALNMAFVLPFVIPATGESAVDARSLRVLMSNVLTHNTDHQAVIDLIAHEEPDVVVLLEVDEAWLKSLAPLADAYPHQVTVPRGDNFGLAVLSRLPLERTDKSALGPDALPAIVTHVALPAGSVALIAGHPLPPTSADQLAQRNAEIQALARLARGQVGRVVLCADLNTGPWSPAFVDLLSDSGLADARRGQGIQATWNVHWPRIAAIPIDHCLVSPEIGVNSLRAGPNVGSDHLPLIADLAVPSR